MTNEGKEDFQLDFRQSLFNLNTIDLEVIVAWHEMVCKSREHAAYKRMAELLKRRCDELDSNFDAGIVNSLYMKFEIDEAYERLTK